MRAVCTQSHGHVARVSQLQVYGLILHAERRGQRFLAIKERSYSLPAHNNSPGSRVA